jgi:hypothetical protein
VEVKVRGIEKPRTERYSLELISDEDREEELKDRIKFHLLKSK